MDLENTNLENIQRRLCEMIHTVVFALGACELYMDAAPFSCKRMRMDIGAGKWKAKQLSVFDKLEIEVGQEK